MSSVAENDTLTIAFTGKLDDGTIFIDVSSEESMQVTIGKSELPPTVEMELVGMQQGESKKVRVDPDEGYGPRLKDLVIEIPRKNFANRLEPLPGMILSQKIQKDGVEQQVPVTVVEVKEDTVVLDYNHPLAGHPLTYELTVLSITKSAEG